MSIAHNQIKDDFKPINKTPEKEILKKKCSECGEIKPIMEFNLTITGKRHQDRCNDCEILALQPKKIPRIVGHGKPLFIEGKAHQTDDLNNHFYENFNKLKEMGDTWLRNEILRKNYGEVKPVEQNTYKQVMGKCKVCSGEINHELLHHGLCPNCWTLKKKMGQEERLKKVLIIIDKLTQTTGREWFTAPSLAKYQHKTYEWAYSNLVRMEEFGMVISQKDDGRKYWKVLKPLKKVSSK